MWQLHNNCGKQETFNIWQTIKNKMREVALACKMWQTTDFQYTADVALACKKWKTRE